MCIFACIELLSATHIGSCFAQEQHIDCLNHSFHRLPVGTSHVQDLKKTLVSPGWVGNQIHLQKIQYFIVHIYVYSMNSIQTKYQYIEMAQLPHAITTLGSWLINTAGSTCKRLGLLLSRPFGKWLSRSPCIKFVHPIFNLTKNAR